VGIRESLNENKRATTAVAVVLVVVAVAVIVYQFMQPDGPQPASGLAYFTTDGGETWFVDDAGRLSPFEKDGKQAVRAYVWSCDGKEFVSHLERLAPESKKKLEAMQAKGVDVGPRKPGQPPGNITMMTLMNDKEVRDPGPGDQGWVKMASAEGRALSAPVCPDGSGGTVEPVAP
jgi:hypothetical protein